MKQYEREALSQLSRVWLIWGMISFMLLVHMPFLKRLAKGNGSPRTFSDYDEQTTE